MKTAKYFNDINFNLLKEAKRTDGVEEMVIKLEPYYGCIKLGMGKIYDDHCYAEWSIKSISYNENIFSSTPREGFKEIVSDIDTIYVKDKIVAAVKFPHEGDDFKVVLTPELVGKLFIQKEQIWSAHGFVGWVSCIPEFSSHEEVKARSISTKFLSKLWRLPSDLIWYEEGHAEAEIEPQVSLKLGNLEKEFPFLRLVEEEDKEFKGVPEEDMKVYKIAQNLKNKDLIISTTDLIAYEVVEKRADWAHPDVVKAISDVAYSFLKAEGADGTEFYYNINARVLKIPKEKLNNPGKFIGKGGQNIKALQKEIGKRIILV